MKKIYILALAILALCSTAMAQNASKLHLYPSINLNNGTNRIVANAYNGKNFLPNTTLPINITLNYSLLIGYQFGKHVEALTGIKSGNISNDLSFGRASVSATNSTVSVPVQVFYNIKPKKETNENGVNIDLVTGINLDFLGINNSSNTPIINNVTNSEEQSVQLVSLRTIRSVGVSETIGLGFQFFINGNKGPRIDMLYNHGLFDAREAKWLIRENGNSYDVTTRSTGSIYNLRFSYPIGLCRKKA